MWFSPNPRELEISDCTQNKYPRSNNEGDLPICPAFSQQMEKDNDPF